MTKKAPDPDTGPFGTGLKIGVHYWDGTEKHRQFIITMSSCGSNQGSSSTKSVC